MHLVYVDDSGDSRRGVLLSALIVEDVEWSKLLGSWLEGRRAIHRTFGVPKSKELHANELFKNRGRYCETDEQSKHFGGPQRAATGRIMLASLARHARSTVVTLGTDGPSTTVAYAKFVAWIEEWAARKRTTAMIFFDGQQGLVDENHARIGDARAVWEAAVRSASPYRNVHRELDLSSRLLIDDVIMQDSRYSQLIQAVDLIAYGAFHRHVQDHPEIWGDKTRPVPEATRAYMRLKGLWPSESDHGVIWLP